MKHANTNLDLSFVSVKAYRWTCTPIDYARRSILDLRGETNPTATQMSERLSVIVRDGLEDVQLQAL